jgi:hypothetical protein
MPSFASRAASGSRLTHAWVWRDPGLGLAGPTRRPGFAASNPVGALDLLAPWVCNPRLLASHLFSSSFSFLPYLDENQVREGLGSFFAIFLLYVRCHCLSECCKTYILQPIRIEVKSIYIYGGCGMRFTKPKVFKVV